MNSFVNFTVYLQESADTGFHALHCCLTASLHLLQQMSHLWQQKHYCGYFVVCYKFTTSCGLLIPVAGLLADPMKRQCPLFSPSPYHALLGSALFPPLQTVAQTDTVQLLHCRKCSRLLVKAPHHDTRCHFPP